MRRRGVLPLFLAILLVPSAAMAQESAGGSDTTQENRALAETLFYAGRGLMQDGRLAEACAKFSESYRLDPAAGTLLNLAVCHERTGRIATAWGEFREARLQAKKDNRPDRLQLADDHITAIEPDLPWLSIVVPQEIRVPGLEIKRNGVALKDAAWGTELPADPGDAEVVASAPGHYPSTLHVLLEKRDHKTVTMTALRRKPVRLTSTREEWSTPKTAGFWTIVGGGVAIGGSGVLGLLAQSQKSKSDSLCPTQDGELRCSAAGVTANKTATTLAWAADAAFGVGIVSVAIGSYLFISSPNKEVAAPEPASPSRVSVDVHLSPALTFAGVRGSF